MVSVSWMILVVSISEISFFLNFKTERAARPRRRRYPPPPYSHSVRFIGNFENFRPG
jgi:hypothetical protein